MSTTGHQSVLKIFIYLKKIFLIFKLILFLLLKTVITYLRHQTNPPSLLLWKIFTTKIEYLGNVFLYTIYGKYY